MAGVDAEDMDSVNNNTMSNNNNSCNINNNAIISNAVLASACAAPDRSSSTPCGSNADSAAAVTNVVSGADATNSSSSNNRSRGTSSRRSRSGGRSRSRRRHSQSSGRHGSRHHSRQNHKRRERNFPSALCSMISIVILCTALAEPRWVRIDNGHCTVPKERTLNYLGVFQFFYFGDVVYDDPNIDHKHVDVIVEYRYGPGLNDSKSHVNLDHHANDTCCRILYVTCQNLNFLDQCINGLFWGAGDGKGVFVKGCFQA